jgi:hypothetical protein
VRPGDRRDRARECDVVLLDPEYRARDPNGEPTRGCGQRHPWLLAQAFNFRHGNGQACRLGEGSDAECGDRPAVQHHPVFQSVGRDVRLPPRFTHVSSIAVLVAIVCHVSVARRGLAAGDIA